MTDQIIFNWAIAVAGFLGGWVLKVIWDAIVRLQDDLKKMDEKMHEDFVRRDDFKDAVKDIKNDMKAGFANTDKILGLIFKKLDNKEDRT